ncbi:OmcA/MtrC family decaheme c-type cytochrome [Shewanella sp. ZOR0012]|uniref:OmcA/MtrC family decaheme c-type cytochrome n=1 Tax=Shewanella sp. ZOR0012 TaxID=1339231 RepID=UPI0006481C56|nr:OmcA/MtrC family decaheme c-type cytochrome [Shewanella sp. ZOR0012]NSM24980.1 OmcA/MtrC family decaheme c-type cytochrome [Shewanella sp. ZOR0012]
MMNAKKSKFALLLAASAVTMALTGCGGSDGNDGKPGEPGGEPAPAIQKLNFTFNKSVVTNGVPSVEFTVTNEDDLPVVGLQKMRFAAAQLLPQGTTGAGNASQWQYFGDETCDLASTCPGTFVDKKNGHYSYTFKMNLTANAKITYNDQLAQRVLIRAYNTPLPDGTLVPNSNAFVDFTADTGAEPSYSRKIVATESCNTCHQDLAQVKHGGAYSDVNYCATCHTAGKVGVGKEFNALVHAKHKDLTLGSLESCQSCHTENEATPDWGNWSRIPTAATCGSCHSTVDFAAGKGHSQQLDNSNCIACHNSTWTAELHTAKTTATKNLINKYGIEASSTINTETKAATISIQVVDASGAAVDIKTILPKVQRLEIITNVGPNNVTLGYSGKDSIFAIKNGALDPKATINDAGKLVYTTTKDLKLGQNGADSDTAFSFVGWSMCSSEGKFVDCADSAFDGVDVTKYTGMKADLAFATLSGKAPSTRHVDSVNMTACANCHSAEFQIHKGKQHAGFVMTEQLSHAKDANGKPIVGVDACVACHTPDGTYANGANKGGFEMKLHVVHGEQGVIKECTQCHNDFNLDAFKVKGALATSAGKYTTPITATCTSCHAPESIGHGLENMGAIVNGDYTQANQAAQSETCFYCHTPTVADHTQVKM